MDSICIYPGPHSEKLSVEHYMPEALGRFTGMDPLRDRICSECNRSLGSRIETQFLRAGPTGFFRWMIGVQGKNGLSPARPFYNRAAGAEPLYMMGRVEGLPCDLYWEADPGSEDVYPLRQIIFDHPIAGSHAIPILAKMQDNPNALLDFLREKGLEHAIPVRLIASSEEIPWLESLVRALGYEPPGNWTELELSPQRIQLIVTTHATSAYFRAVAKIAFHYVLKMEPDLTGHEQEFDAIKRYIWEDESSEQNPSRFVKQLSHQFISNFNRGLRFINWTHVLAVERGGGHITAHAQFFAGPRSLPPPYQISIGPDPSSIIKRPRRSAHLYVILSAGPDQVPTGIMDDANPVNHILVPRLRSGAI